MRSNKEQIFSKAQRRYELIQAFSQNPVSESVVDKIRNLTTELSNRILSLTPNNKTFQQEFSDRFDIDLILQMFKHQAFDATDIDHLVNTIFDRLQSLCAPIQDDAIAEAKRVTHAESHVPTKLAILFEFSNEILDDIERLSQI